jgi:hypothetical protein
MSEGLGPAYGVRASSVGNEVPGARTPTFYFFSERFAACKCRWGPGPVRRQDEGKQSQASHGQVLWPAPAARLKMRQLVPGTRHRSAVLKAT